MMRVLFVCEHATWSQMVRSLVLARALDPARYQVHFACGSFAERLFSDAAFQRWPLESLPASKIEASVARGERLYEPAVLSRYVDAERRLFERVQPDVVVSDLRWSTAISAPLSGVPCASIVNAFWSPHARRARFPLPDHPILKLVGLATAEKYFPLALPRVLAHFARPVNDLRKRHGLPELGSLQDVLTWGDCTLFPDDPLLIPMGEYPSHQLFLGPVLWSPAEPPDDELDALGRARPLIYVTLGSSGDLRALPVVLSVLGALPVDVLVSSAGRALPTKLPPNVLVRELVPGDAICARAALVVCNGGASTAYQALASGTPVLGIPSNLDQFLAMGAIADYGAGLLLRASTLRAADVAGALQRMAHDPSFRARATELARSFARIDVHARFRAALTRLTSPREAATTAPPGETRAP